MFVDLRAMRFLRREIKEREWVYEAAREEARRAAKEAEGADKYRLVGRATAYLYALRALPGYRG